MKNKFPMKTMQQLMVITMEECGELIQECSKCMRRDEFHNREKLIEEAGDVMAMIELMVENDLMSWSQLEERSDKKKAKLAKWSDLV